MATPYNGFDLPVVGAEADTWGNEINTIITAIDTLLSSPANTIKGNNTGAQVATIDLTPAQATAMFLPVVGASQGLAGAKGLVPQPAAAQQNRVLAGDGTWRDGLGRSFGLTATTTGVNGSVVTISNTLNVASVSNLTVVSGTALFTITFTNTLPNAGYQVALAASGALNSPGVTNLPRYTGNKTTTTLEIAFFAASGEISVSGF